MLSIFDHSMEAKGTFSSSLRNPSTRAWRLASLGELNHAAKAGCWLPLVQSSQPKGYVIAPHELPRKFH